MKNAEKLYLAIGEIDDSIIEESSKDYKKPIPILKYATIAACAALVTVGIFSAAATGLLGLKGKFEPSGDVPGFNGSASGDMESSSPNGDMENGSPSVEYSDFGSIRVEQTSVDTITLFLKITAYCPDELNISLYSKDMSAVYTTAEGVNGLVFKPTITVNGAVADGLPTNIGEYEITVKFDNINTFGAVWQDYILIDGFEPIYHGLIFN